MSVTLAECRQLLVELKLVTEAELSQFDVHSNEPLDSKSGLLNAMVTQGKLTSYQARAILGGQGRKLILGGYLILDLLGKGGMGVVLKARHPRMKHVVAIKTLSSELSRNPESAKRFQREVHAAAKLEHPNIVRALDADVSKGTPYLVLEFVDGKDLGSVVREQGPFRLEQALNLLSQAATGLEYAHQCGVIHRDIKPANLLLDKLGTVKILDMGLARLDENRNQAETAFDITNTGAIMGTVDYMSPEQALNTKKADHRSDIYSLGITLFYLLTGRTPYEGDSVMERLLAHREQPIPDLRTLRPDIPPAVQNLFERMVAKKPENRPQSMTNVISEIQLCNQDGAHKHTVVSSENSPASTQPDSTFPNFVLETTNQPKPLDGRPPHVTKQGPAVNSDDSSSKSKSKPKSFNQLWIAGGIALSVVVFVAAGLSGKFNFSAKPVENHLTAGASKTADHRNNKELKSKAKSTTQVNKASTKNTVDREIAEWMLTLGTKPAIIHESKLQSIASITDLPATDFQLAEVHFDNCKGIADSDLARLSELENLTKVSVHACPFITDDAVPYLAKLKSLEFLGIEHSGVTEKGLTGIAEQTSITVLSASGDQVTDLSAGALAKSKTLTSVILRHATDASVIAISKLPNLQVLTFYGEAVSPMAYESLANTKSLRKLEFHPATITSIEHIHALVKCRHVVSWYFVGRRITDELIKPLESLPRDVTLIFTYTYVTEGQIKRFQMLGLLSERRAG